MSASDIATQGTRAASISVCYQRTSAPLILDVRSVTAKFLGTDRFRTQRIRRGISRGRRWSLGPKENAMKEVLKTLGGGALALLFILAAVLVPVLFIRGGVWLGELL